MPDVSQMRPAVCDPLIVADHIKKLSPRKGDVLLFCIKDQHDLSSLATAQAIYDQCRELGQDGKIDPDVPVVILYGKDQLVSMGGKHIGSLCKTGFGVEFQRDDEAARGYPRLAEVYEMVDGRILSCPVDGKGGR